MCVATLCSYIKCSLTALKFCCAWNLDVERQVYQIFHFDNKEFLCITHTVEHNYISPSSTVGIQLYVSALYVGHLQVVI